VLDLRLEGFNEVANDFIRVCMVREIDSDWQTEIRSEGQYPGVLLKCQIYGAPQARQVLPDEGAFLDHHWQAFEGVVVVQAEVGVIGKTKHGYYSLGLCS
jgi:hypothetical protein